MNTIPLLSTVALTEDVPASNLTRGQIGTVVEHLGEGVQSALLVEFADEEGRAYAIAALPPHQLLVLHREHCAA
jgi:hypothetical protein